MAPAVPVVLATEIVVLGTRAEYQFELSGENCRLTAAVDDFVAPNIPVPPPHA